MAYFNVIIFSFWNLLAVTLSLLYKQYANNFVYSCQFGINFKMECKNEHFRHILLFYFRKRKNAEQAAKKLRDLYGEEASKDRQYQNWFNKFRSGDFSLKDKEHSGQPNEVDDDQIKAIIEPDSHVIVQEIEEMLKYQNQQTTVIYNVLNSLKNLIFGFQMN